jgi:PII-like signaling protein
MSGSTKLLRIYTDEAAYFGDRRVFEVIVIRAREARLAGATVLSALIGFGRGSHVHSRHFLDEDRSVVVEIVEDESKLRRFVAGLTDLPSLGLMTLEQVEVLSPQPVEP